MRNTRTTDFDPMAALDLEMALSTQVNGLKGMVVMVANDGHRDCGPGELSAMLDLFAKNAEVIQTLAGYGMAPTG